MAQQQLVRPVPLDFADAVAGPPPHPNCRCTACIPEPSFPVRADVLYGVPVLAKPYGVLSMAEGDSYVTEEQARTYMLPDQVVRVQTDRAVAYGELVYGSTVDGGSAPVGLALETVGAGEFVDVRCMLPLDAEGHAKPAAQGTFTQQVLDQIAQATGVPLPVLTGDTYEVTDIKVQYADGPEPGPGTVGITAAPPTNVEFKFDDQLFGALSKMSESLLGLDNEVVREVMRQAAAETEEAVRYQMVTGERPPDGVRGSELKAAVDFYLATGRLPAPPPVPAPPPKPAPELPRHRRAMKLQGKLR